MNLQTQVIKTQVSGTTIQTGPHHTRKMSRSRVQGTRAASELATRRLSESLTSSVINLGNNAESAYHRIQDHVQRTVVDLGSLSNKLNTVVTSSSGTIQDLTYSDDMLAALEDAELALNRTLIKAKLAVERLGHVQSGVVCKAGGPGADTVRRVQRASESELQERDPFRGTTVSESSNRSVKEEGVIRKVEKGVQETFELKSRAGSNETN